MSKSKLQIPLIFSLLFLLATPVSVKADDQVSITIQMSGDAYVKITNTNGTVTFIYNGRDFLKKYEWTVDRVNSNKLAIMLLRRDMKRLVYALNETFADLYGKVYFLAHVTGVTSNSSRVTMQLRSGNTTLADFIDQLLNATEKQNLEIRQLRIRISSNENETKEELNKVWNEMLNHKSELQKLNGKLQRLNGKFNQLQQETTASFGKLYDHYKGLTLRMERMEISEKTCLFSIVVLGIFDLFMVIMLVWIASWKAKKT